MCLCQLLAQQQNGVPNVSHAVKVIYSRCSVFEYDPSGSLGPIAVLQFLPGQPRLLTGVNRFGARIMFGGGLGPNYDRLAKVLRVWYVHAMCVRCACYVRAMCVLCVCYVSAMCAPCACYARAMCVLCACYVCVLCACYLYAMWVLCACYVRALCVLCACYVRAVCMLYCYTKQRYRKNLVRVTLG